MKVSFTTLLLNDPGLFQQIVGNNATHRIPFVIELDVHVFPKTAAIVVAVSFRISKTLQNCIALN